VFVNQWCPTVSIYLGRIMVIHQVAITVFLGFVCKLQVFAVA
jgi:hypothetical protein